MKTMLALAILLAGVGAGAQTTSVYEDPQSTREAVVAANEALPKLVALARQVPAAVGLSADEAAAATIEPPLRVVDVPLDRLKTYRSTDDVGALLIDIQAAFVPVAVGGTTRTSIVLQRRDARWAATDFGQAELAKLITAARGTTPGAILVRVPALNLFFIGRQTAGGLTLTPVSDFPMAGLRQAVTATASDVLTALVPIAQAHNGDPT
jgi:hypothetical protein